MSQLIRWLTERWAMCLVFVLSLLATGIVVNGVLVIERRERATAQASSADELSGQVRSQFEVYSHVLRMLRGFYQGSTHVSIAEFREFARAADISRLGGGSMGLGYVALVDASESDRFVLQMEEEGLEGFQLWATHGDLPTEGEMRVLATVEPREINGGAIGADVTNHTAVMATLDEAAQSGQAVFTSPIRLLQRPGEWGAVCYLPLYNEGGVPETGEGRRGSLYGWVSVVVSLTQMMDEIAINRPAYDHFALLQQTADGERAVFDTCHAEEKNEAGLPRCVEAIRARGAEERVMVAGGRVWTIVYSNGRPGGVLNSASVRTAVVGLLTTFLLTAFAWSLIRTRDRAETIADTLTQSHKESEAFARCTVDALHTSVVILDERGVIVATNQAWDELARTFWRGRVGAVGEDYLSACQGPGGLWGDDGAEIATAVRLILSGAESRYEHQHEATVGESARTFTVHATRFDWTGPARVVLALEDITEQETDRRYLELVTRGDLVLRLFDHLAFEFLDPPALDTDEMVVVLLLDLVAGHAVVETPFARQPRVTQELHRAIDGRVADVRMIGANASVDLLAGDVAGRFEKCCEDRLTLFGVFEVVLLEVLRQRSLFDLVRHRATLIERAERFNHCATAADGVSNAEADLSRDGRALELRGERFGEFGHFVVGVLGEHADL